MRFFMMLVSVAVSAGLVFAGLALLDMCIFDDFGSSAIIGIAIVVVVFCGTSTAVVINTLTTINISERNREIATPMVLGYHDREICGYIYREIYISTFIGILFGYPVGIGLATLVFKTIGFGTVGGVNWFMWLLVPVIVFGFTLLVTLLLRPKIVKTRDERKPESSRIKGISAASLPIAVRCIFRGVRQKRPLPPDGWRAIAL